MRSVGRSPEISLDFPRVVSHVFMFLAVCFENFVFLGLRSRQVYRFF